MAKALSESVAYTEMMHKTSEAVCASMAPALVTFVDSIKSITAGVRLDSIRAVLDSINSSGWLSSYRASEVMKVVSAQQELLAACTASLQTPAIRDMADRFASKDYFGVYESLASSLSGLTVRGPDIALLGNVGGLVDSLGDFGYGGSIPRGTKTFVKNLSRSRSSGSPLARMSRSTSGERGCLRRTPRRTPGPAIASAMIPAWCPRAFARSTS
ncbi:MAG: hypothetical protein ACLTXI_01605 [Collinsella sp.]